METRLLEREKATCVVYWSSAVLFAYFMIIKSQDVKYSSSGKNRTSETGGGAREKSAGGT